MMRRRRGRFGGSGLPVLLAAACSMATGAVSARAVPLDGWQPDPDAVERASARGGFNYREEQIPDYELPKILVTEEGERVESVREWEAVRRPEILELFRTHVYGRRPGTLDGIEFQERKVDEQAMDGAATLRVVEIICRKEDRRLSIELILFVPNKGEAPHPAFLLINNRDKSNTDPSREEKSDFWPAEAIVARGYAAAAIHVSDMDPDRHDGFENGVHALFSPGTEHPPDGWGSLSAWGWGASRVLDYFEAEEAVDATRVAVVGHSRGGKAALWAGAEDERFALVISNDSGCGGAALSRRRFGETVERITRSFPHWFCGNFSKYGGREDELPVDQHMLVALMAPRAVYIASASEDLWADPRGEFLSLREGGRVYGLWDLPHLGGHPMPEPGEPVRAGRLGYHLREGGHNLTRYDWERYMDFVEDQPKE